VTINSLPDAPTANNVTVCYDGKEHTASATVGSDQTIVWYYEAKGSTTSTQPGRMEPGTTTAYAAAKITATDCESATRTPESVTIHSLPDAPTANNVTVCYDPTDHTASATVGSGQTVVWYSEATGSTTANQPSRKELGTTTAYAAAKITATGCESATRTPVSVTINSLPDAPTANNVTVCYEGKEHAASATVGSGQTVVWYSAATGSTTAIQPRRTESGITTVYAAAKITATGCESATRTQVSVTINSLPDAPKANNVTVW
jgi:hypothetical protein